MEKAIAKELTKKKGLKLSMIVNENLCASKDRLFDKYKGEFTKAKSFDAHFESMLGE